MENPELDSLSAQVCFWSFLALLAGASSGCLFPTPHKGLKVLYFVIQLSVAAIPPFLSSLKDMVSLVIMGSKEIIFA